MTPAAGLFRFPPCYPAAMAKPDLDSLARRFVNALAVDTGNRPMQWREVGSIATRARLGADAEKAVAHAKALGWVEVVDGHSVQLTDTGRQVARA